MAQTFDAGHEETERNLPGPLQSGWYPGIWALPATTLSLASSVVLTVVFAFLLAGATSRALFRLPMAPAWALTSAVLAWSVVFGCRNRPGRLLPRAWAILLSAGTTILALVCLLGRELALSPPVQALVLASLAAAVTLLPRLLYLQPDHWLVQHIAPLALAFVLFVTLPASFYIGQRMVAKQKRRVEATIAELSRQAGDIREISAFDWSRIAEQREETLRQIQRLQALPLERWLPDRYLWQGAARLGEDGQLGEAYRDLLDAVLTGMNPAHTPKLSHPQFNGSDRGWSRDPQFVDLSAAVAGYHLRIGQLFQSLDPPAGESPAMRELATDYGEKEREVETLLTALSKTWNEDWIPSLVAPRESQPRWALSPLPELLRRPLPPDGALRPASLERLLALRLRRARQMADPSRGCVGRPYHEGDSQFFRIDCYAYASDLAASPPRASLRAEMRVVYKSQELRSLRENDLPVEVYFLFPVPPDTDPAQYREDVMRSLEAAAREDGEGSEVVQNGRSSSTGFALAIEARRRSAVVTSHPITDMSGEGTESNGRVPGIGVRARYRDGL